MGSAESISDACIRPVLWRLLDAAHCDEPDTLIVDELGLCQGDARVDVAVINGSIHGYEIKSERDSLERLSRQVSFYGRCLNHATVVATEGHIGGLLRLIPDWWGLALARPDHRDLSIDPLRPARDNPSIEPEAVVQLLWRREALEVLQKIGIDKGVRSKPRRELWNRLVENLPAADLQVAVTKALKQRRIWKRVSARIAALGPSSLQPLTWASTSAR